MALRFLGFGGSTLSGEHPSSEVISSIWSSPGSASSNRRVEKPGCSYWESGHAIGRTSGEEETQRGLSGKGGKRVATKIRKERGVHGEKGGAQGPGRPWPPGGPSGLALLE